MSFIEQTEIPKFWKPRSKIDAELTEFMRMNVKCVRVTFGENEYSSVKSAQNILNTGAKRTGFPIKARQRKGKLYLVRTDM